MSDKELLEYAAKAYGLPSGYKWVNLPGSGFVRKPNDPCELEQWWNPLKSDGDALRLLVKLKLRAGVDASYAFCYSHTSTLDPQSHTELTNDASKDLRRMIVNVAAEIGKAMP